MSETPPAPPDMIWHRAHDGASTIHVATESCPICERDESESGQ